MVVLSAQSRRDRARCPDRSYLSRMIHSYYRRRPADLPFCGRQVRLDLQLRRYIWINATCRRRTFAERLPMLVEDRASAGTQTTQWVNGPGTPASPERGRPFRDAQDLRDTFCGRQIGFQMALGGATQRTDSWETLNEISDVHFGSGLALSS